MQWFAVLPGILAALFYLHLYFRAAKVLGHCSYNPESRDNGFSQSRQKSTSVISLQFKYPTKSGTATTESLITILHIYSEVRYEVFMVLKMRSDVGGYQHSGQKCCLHLHSKVGVLPQHYMVITTQKTTTWQLQWI